MTRARELSKLINASSFSVDSDFNVGVNSTSPDVKLDVGGAVLVTGISTFENTTQSTSSTTGALIVSGGVGIAKSLNVGGNLSVAGTITYDDVTNIDSVGIVTAQSGINIVGGGLTVTGVSTFFDNVDLGDDDRLRFGDGQELEIYSNGSSSFIKESGSGNLKLLGTNIVFKDTSDSEFYADFNKDGSVELYYNNSKKFETTTDGVVITGIATATSFFGDGSGLSGVGGENDITSSLFI